MELTYRLLILLALLVAEEVSAVTINCKYQTWSAFSVIGHENTTYCKSHDVIITKPHQVVDDVNSSPEGNHLVGGFACDGLKKMHYMPSGIDEIFENLIILFIKRVELKIITQSDLKVFPELIGIWLLNNNLEVLEKDLFEFNRKLTYIALENNNFRHIDGNIFAQLSGLKTARMVNNNCINLVASDTFAIRALKNAFMENCQDETFVEIHECMAGVHSNSQQQRSKYSEDELAKELKEIKAENQQILSILRELNSRLQQNSV